MRLQCHVLRNLVEEHLLLLLHPQHKFGELPYKGGVLPKQSFIDDPVPYKLALGLQEDCGQGYTIRR